MFNSKKADDEPCRRRGRPAGKNRVPLSLEERRARNALYERERRNETANAMSELAEAAGCDPNIANAELLAQVIHRLQGLQEEENIEDLVRQNGNLESQIEMLQRQLGINDEQLDQIDEEDNRRFVPAPKSSSSSCSSHEEQPTQRETQKRKRPDTKKRQVKRLKIQKNPSTDSGIETHSQSVSPTEIFPGDCVVPEQLQLNIMEEPNPNEFATVDDSLSQTYVGIQTDIFSSMFNCEVPQSEQILETYVLPQEPSELYLEQPTQPDLCNVLNIEPQATASTFDFLTDNETSLINQWLDTELQDTINDQTPTTSYDTLPTYF